MCVLEVKTPSNSSLKVMQNIAEHSPVQIWEWCVQDTINSPNNNKKKEKVIQCCKFQ